MADSLSLEAILAEHSDDSEELDEEVAASDVTDILKRNSTASSTSSLEKPMTATQARSRVLDPKELGGVANLAANVDVAALGSRINLGAVESAGNAVRERRMRGRGMVMTEDDSLQELRASIKQNAETSVDAILEEISSDEDDPHGTKVKTDMHPDDSSTTLASMIDEQDQEDNDDDDDLIRELVQTENGEGQDQVFDEGGAGVAADAASLWEPPAEALGEGVLYPSDEGQGDDEREIPEEVLQAILDDTDDMNEDVDVEAVMMELERELEREEQLNEGGSQEEDEDEEKDEAEKRSVLESVEASVMMVLRNADEVEMRAPLRERRDLTTSRQQQQQHSAGPGGGASAAHQILRVSPKKTISSILSSQSTKQQVGQPTSIALHEKLIAVGTSYGMVLVFDHFEQQIHTLFYTSSMDSSHDSFGAVTSLDVSPGSEYLVAGYQGGQVVLWDVVTGIWLKTVSEQHTSPIVHVRFFHRNKCHVLVLDNKGNANMFKYSKMFGIWRTEVSCILDGNVTGVLYDCSVLLPNDKVEHATDHCGLIAFASPDIVFIICCWPKVEMLYKLPRPYNVREGALPYLAWRRVMERNDKVVHPVLCVGWGRVVRLIQVVAIKQKYVDPVQSAMRGGSTMAAMMGLNSTAHVTFEFMNICEYASDGEFTGMEWLAEQVLLFLNTKGQIRVLDPFAMQELDSIDVNNLQMVFQAHFSGPGGQEYSFYNSFRCKGSELFLLGIKQLQTARVLSWSERLTALSDAGDWLDALALAIDFHQGCAKAVVGLPRNAKALHNVLGKRMNELLDKFIEHCGKTTSDNGQGNDMAMQAGVCVDFCVTMDRLDLLFGMVHEYFSINNKQGLLLETLEPYVLSDRVTTMDERVMGEVVAHYTADADKARRLERMLLHLDVAKLSNLDVLIEVCRSHGLFIALFVIYNKGLGDYFTPMRTVISRLRQEPSDPDTGALQPGPAAVQCGRLLLLYIARCVAGRTFPHNLSVPEGRLPLLKSTLFDFLFKPCSAEELDEVRNGNGVDTPYQHLFYLLQLDTEETLNVLLDAIADQDFVPSNAQAMRAAEDEGAEYVAAGEPAAPADGPAVNDGQNEVKLDQYGDPLPPLPPGPPPPGEGSVGLGAAGSTQAMLSSAALAQQAVLDILVTMLLGPEERRAARMGSSDPAEAGEGTALAAHDAFSPLQQGFVFHFLAKVLIHGKVRVSHPMLKHTLMWLATASSTTADDALIGPSTAPQRLPSKLEPTSAAEKKERSQRQQLLVQLLESLETPAWASLKTDLLVKLERSHFYKVLSWLHDREGDYSQAIDCQLKDPRLQHELFDYVQRVMADKTDRPLPLSLAERDRVKDKVISRLHELIKVDSSKTAALIAEVFTDEHDRVVKQLEAYPHLQYEYLRGIIQRSDKGQGGQGGADLFDDEFMGGSGGAGGVRVSEHEHERYIELMAEHDPSKVYAYLISHNTYRLDFALKVCEAHQITDASSYLKERTGDVSGALKLIISSIYERLRELRRHIEKTHPVVSAAKAKAGLVERRGSGGDGTTADEVPGQGGAAFHATEAELRKAISICERNASQGSDEGENQQLWFQLLDTFALPLRRLKKNVKGSTTRGTISDRMHEALTALLTSVLNSMTGEVPFTAILEKMGSEYGEDEFGEFRSMIKGMLDTYGYEKSVLSTSKKICNDDLFQAVTKLQSLRNRGVTPINAHSCGLCGVGLGDLINSNGRVDCFRVFNCGHSFHVQCMGRSEMCMFCQSEKKKRTRDSRRVSQEMEDAFINNVDVYGGEGGGGENEERQRIRRQTEDNRYFKRLDAVRSTDRTRSSTYTLLKRLEDADEMGPGPTGTGFEGSQAIDNLYVLPDDDPDAPMAPPGSLPHQPKSAFLMQAPV